MSKILGTNLTFDKLVFSGSFVYADGHLCLNHPDYVINFRQHRAGVLRQHGGQRFEHEYGGMLSAIPPCVW